jgi:hypothetical protein
MAAQDEERAVCVCLNPFDVIAVELASCGTFLDMLIIYFAIVLICFLLQFFHRGLRIGLL